MKRGDVKVGARLLRVEDVDRRGKPPLKTWVIVTTIGRKWASFEDENHRGRPHMGGRFDLDSFRLDGGGFTSMGRVWLDELDYDLASEAKETWRRFKTAMRDNWSDYPPNGLDAGDIREIAKRLGMELS